MLDSEQVRHGGGQRGTGAMRVAIYSRISDDRDGDRLGVERRAKACRVVAEANGWEVVDEYLDNDISAADNGGGVKKRDEYDRMMRDAAGGRFERIMVDKYDRLFRSVSPSEEFMRAYRAAGLSEVWTESGVVNIKTQPVGLSPAFRLPSMLPTLKRTPRRSSASTPRLPSVDSGTAGGDPSATTSCSRLQRADVRTRLCGSTKPRQP